MVRKGQAGLALGIALAIAGCSKKPEGQVVATVDGSEVTRRDLVTELTALGGRSDADLKAAQGALTGTLVDRKLLVAEAKREKLDKNPQFLAAEQRQRELLLASMLAQTLASHVKAPDAAATQAFIAANPQMFGGRKLLLASEISAPSKSISMRAIEPLHGQDAVIGYLKANKVQYSQRTSTIDTLTLPKDLANKLLTLPPGEPLAIVNNGVVVFTTVLNSKDAPVPANQQANVAKAAIQRQGATKQVEDQLKQLRGAADIKYLPGFAPPKTPGSPPTS